MNRQRSLFLSSLVVTAMTAVFTVSVVHARPLAAPAGVLAQDEDWVTVEAEGRGASLVAAKQDAIANGLRQLVGEYVRSETVIEDDEIVKDVIKSFATGQQIKSEQIGNPELSDDGSSFVVRMRVSTLPTVLVAEYEAAAASAVFMDGDTLAAELEFAAGNIEKQREVLAELTLNLPAKLLVNRLVDREGKPIDGTDFPRNEVKRLQDGSTVIALNMQSYFDLQGWYGSVEPNLRAALSAMALGKAESALSFDLRPLNTKRIAAYPEFSDADPIGQRGRVPTVAFEGLGRADDSEELILFLSRSRDRFGQSEIFDAYRIPIRVVPQENFFKTEKAEFLIVRVSLLAANGAILLQRDVPVGNDVYLSGSGSRQEGVIKLDEVSYFSWHMFGVFSYIQEDWPVESNGRLRSEFLTPRFGSSGDYAGQPLRVTDVVATRFEIKLGDGVLEQVAKVVFDTRMGYRGSE